MRITRRTVVISTLLLLAGSAALWTRASRARVEIQPLSSPVIAASSPMPSSPAVDRSRGWVGVLLAARTVELATKIEGKITKVHARPGDHVKQGDVLATIDVRAQKKELAVLQASAGSAHARYARRARAAKAAGDETVISPEELASARDEAHIASARAEQLRVTLADGTIRAPFEGVVASRYVEEGAYVRAGVPLLRLIDDRGLRVRFAIPEHAPNKPAVGTALTVATANATIAATVETISPEVDAAARMVFAEARVELTAQGAHDVTLIGRTVRVVR